MKNKIAIILCTLFLLAGYATGRRHVQINCGEAWAAGYNYGERHGRKEVLAYAYKKRLLRMPEELSKEAFWTLTKAAAQN